jgi:hypothetical protein
MSNRDFFPFALTSICDNLLDSIRNKSSLLKYYLSIVLLVLIVDTHLNKPQTSVKINDYQDSFVSSISYKRWQLSSNEKKTTTKCFSLSYQSSSSWSRKPLGISIKRICSSSILREKKKFQYRTVLDHHVDIKIIYLSFEKLTYFNWQVT